MCVREREREARNKDCRRDMQIDREGEKNEGVWIREKEKTRSKERQSERQVD